MAMHSLLLLAIFSCMVCSSANGHTVLTEPSPYKVSSGNDPLDSAGPTAPCGKSNVLPTGTTVVLAGFPFWADWVEDGHSQLATERIMWSLLDTSTKAVVLANFTTTPFHTPTVGTKGEITIPLLPSTAVPDGAHDLQLFWTLGGIKSYSCASLDVVAPLPAAGFPDTSPPFTVLTGANTGGAFSGNAKMFAYHPSLIGIDADKMFYRVTTTGQAITLAKGWAPTTLDRTQLSNAIPSISNWDGKSSSTGASSGVFGLCRRINSNTPTEYFINVIPDQGMSGQVTVSAYSGVISTVETNVARHDGYMFFYTQANSADNKPRRIVFRARDGGDFGPNFLAEISENCGMTTNKFTAAAVAGDAHCVDLDQRATTKYIRTSNAALAYTIYVDDGKCETYSESAGSILRAGAATLLTLSAMSTLAM